MSWISPIEMNMSISRNVYEGNSKNAFVALAQKVAIYLIIPMALIVFFEAVIKNLIFINLFNIAITILNSAHYGFYAYFGN